MAVTQNLDEIIARCANGYCANYSWWNELPAAITATLFTGQIASCGYLGKAITLPNPLPTGVSKYIATQLSMTLGQQVGGTWLLAKTFSMGSINISTNVFTDGAAFPTVTEFGNSTSTSGLVIARVTTVLNATPGSLTVTYTDQDGNTSQSTGAVAMTASAAVDTCGFVIPATDDVGIRDITAVSRTGGTSPTGIIEFEGIIPVAMGLSVSVSSGANTYVENLLTGVGMTFLGAGDTLEVFVMNTLTTKISMGQIFIVGDSV